MRHDPESLARAQEMFGSSIGLPTWRNSTVAIGVDRYPFGSPHNPYSYCNRTKLPTTLPETNIAPKNGWLEY